MRRRRWMVASSASLVTVLAFGVALAGPPCVKDVQKLCPDVPPGGGRVQACLEKQKANISDDCRKQVDRFTQEIGTLAAMCRNDITRFCSDTAPGGGRVLACLRSNAEDLSPECSAGLKPAK